MTRAKMLGAAFTALVLAGCQSGDTPGADGNGAVTVPDADSTEAFQGIAEDEVLRLIGTEPFWGGQVTGRTFTYTTPDNPDGVVATVDRFEGRGGLSFSGTLDGASLEMAVTPLACSDNMTDRTFPFTVTLKIDEETRNGCAWSEQHPFEGAERP